MKADVNKENDDIFRKGKSAVHRKEKEKSNKKDMLKDPETLKATMDYIFGHSDENPLKK